MISNDLADSCRYCSVVQTGGNMKKNKLYDVLIPVYAVTVIFILYINGIFTGNVGSFVNLLINVGFLAVIGVLLYLSRRSFKRLDECTEELATKAKQLEEEYKNAAGKNLWPEYQNKANIFSDTELNEAFVKYQLRMKNYQTKRGYKVVCDIDEYINEDLLDRIGKSFYNSNMPGTLTGLGILGTFLGLSMGLASFSGDNIFTISENVGPLLEGMKVAFHTSVYGIFFSLVFGFVYKRIMADAYEKLDDFQNMFRQAVMPVMPAEDEHAAAMLIYQAGMSNALKQMLELLKGEAKEQTDGVERMVSQFTQQLGVSMGTNFKELGNALQYTADIQNMAIQNQKELLETVETLTAVNRETQKVMNSMLDRQEYFAKELEMQKAEIGAACSQMSNEISSQLYAFEQMRNLYEK